MAATILADADHEAFLAGATAARCAAEGVQITLISPNPAHPDVDQVVCELVAHIRQCRPDVVITSGPWDGRNDVDRMAISQDATAAVMRAPDPRYGMRAVPAALTPFASSTTRPPTAQHHMHRCRHVLPRVQHCWVRTQYRNGPVRWSAHDRHASGRAGVTMQTSVRSQTVTELVARASSREPGRPADAKSQSTIERLSVEASAPS